MTDLTEFGWSAAFAQHLPPGSDDAPGRVVAEHRTIYRVQTADGECVARVAGRLRHEGGAAWPAVGDWVALQRDGAGGEAVIRRVLPRRSSFSRKAAGERTEEQVVAANVDVVWVVCGLDGDYSPRRIERYLAVAWGSGAVPAVVLNKADLCVEHEDRRGEVEALSPGVAVHVTSAVTGEGLGELRADLAGCATVALLGSSGVGKSTLINALAGTELQRTGEVRAEDSKGRHTTTHRQLLRLPGGGLIVDTPGMRELQLWDAESGVRDTFGEIEELASLCRFADCGHVGEPGCAVAAAVADGRLPAERLASYHKLRREQTHLDRRQDARARSEETRRWKAIHKSLRGHPKYRR